MEDKNVKVIVQKTRNKDKEETNDITINIDVLSCEGGCVI